ncbi:SapC family protein [Oceanospirillum sanctuarii]|uniref:SapC family protein n=1 Tax=Oceanospirillum sanctuarii TaxID=1434821 RepID=UPI00159409F9|nr:SapC family protein [Oceanospirillum sanctuarii]
MNNQTVDLFSPDHDYDLRFHEEPDLSFASQWTSVPVHIKEAVELSQSLPVVFRRNPTGTIEIIALFTCNGEHLIKKGQWSLKQQPDLLDLYPFTWMLKQRDIKLAYYPQAPHFQGKGQKLLTSKGKPTRKLNDVIKGLDKAQSFFSVTGQRMMELVRFNLLTPITVAQNVTLPQETYLVLKEPVSEEIRSQLSGEVAHLLDCHVKSLALLPAINGALTASAEAAPKAAEKKASAKKAETKEAAEKKAPAKKASEKKASEKKTEPVKKAEPKAAAANSAAGIDGIIDAACAKFEVSRDDLQSRKRNDLLTQARNQLAAEAKAADSLKEMAAWLERSPATLNSWLK